MNIIDTGFVRRIFNDGSCVARTRNVIFTTWSLLNSFALWLYCCRHLKTYWCTRRVPVKHHNFMSQTPINKFRRGPNFDRLLVVGLREGSLNSQGSFRMRLIWFRTARIAIFRGISITAHSITRSPVYILKGRKTSLSSVSSERYVIARIISTKYVHMISLSPTNWRLVGAEVVGCSRAACNNDLLCHNHST